MFKLFKLLRNCRSCCLAISMLTAFFLSGCSSSSETLFVLLKEDKTGIDFSNTIFESDSFNIFLYDYIYNGGGVAVSDFNNDGLQDIFFTGNMVPNKLYLNKGELEFQDVTNVAKINKPDRWNSGVTVVDINDDGWQDIYVCSTMKEDSLLRANMLFLNKGVDENNIPVFEEVASQYGIADAGHSVMASFFDYDRDGDLDLYVLTNKHTPNFSSNYKIKVNDGSSPSNDRFYKNNGDGTFSNVTKQAGIVYEGFGLGLAISDVNSDGWPDIYVSNDFITNDILYINNQDGTFTNRIPQWMGHQSQFSMGNDAADFNNDGMTDLITVDMLPETNERKKTMINNKSYSTYINNERYHYEYQYMRNMLHLNNNAGSAGFSEIGQMSGVNQTEWSWSPLFADFDNDGLKDLLITNGFPKDITDKDFVTYREDVGAYVSYSKLLDSVPVIKIPNYAFKNNGDLTFTDVSKAWGITEPSFSNGAAFADLDNDGDLDYVINNINDKAFVYENTTGSKGKTPTQHYLRLKLIGPSHNKNAIGTNVKLYYDNGKFQMLEHYIARGYLSSVEELLHFGLGKTTKTDSLIVTWPDGNIERLENVELDRVDTIRYDPAKFITRKIATPEPMKLFSEISGKLKLHFKHDEEDRIDYNVQRTLPHKFSQSGPGIAVGDVTGDGLEDFIVGGSAGHYFSIFTQLKDGSFSESEFLPKSSEKKEEDEGLLLFDADGDSDLDLYVVSGGIESSPGSKDYQDQLYRNSGRGKFALDTMALPKMWSSGSCIRAADFDGDDDLDLFIGGRGEPVSYPYPSTSYLLRNDNGKFVNVTDTWCPEMSKLGMITDAMFTDFDADGKTDVVVVGEFLPVVFFRNMNDRFTRVDSTGIENNVGWWNSISGGDFDNDGDIDYVAGNLGLNNPYHVTTNFPLCVYAKDFDKNGSVDAILSCYVKESLNNDEKQLFPIHFWDEMNTQSPRFRKQFSKYKQFGKTTMKALFKEEELVDALILRANYMESSYIENAGNGKFIMHALPAMAQVAPVNGQVVDDLNGDGNLDVLMVGNDYGNEVFAGRYDAFTGMVLLGNGKGNFALTTSAQNGFYVRGDAKGLARLSGIKEDMYIATRNKDSLAAFTVGPRKYDSIDPLATDSWAEVVFNDGRKRRVEFYYGSGYLSQSTRKLKLNDGITSLVFHSFNGKARQKSIK